MPLSTSERLVTVLGGAGYIGAVLTRMLLQEKYQVRVFDNFSYGPAGIEGLESPDLEVIEGDICDIKSVSSAISGAETVILLAAIVGRRVIEDVQPRWIREVNLLASSIVLDAAIEHGASRFIFASTDSVYGLQSGIMYETGTPEPVSLYSRLKLRVEEQIIKAKRRSFHPTALRIATCYGYSPRMRFDLVINGLIRDAVCRKAVLVESGEQCRAFVHVEDCARAIVNCLKAHVNLVSGEVFNLGATEQVVTLNSLANTLKLVTPDVAVEILDGEPDLVDYHLSCSKIEKILDFSPKWTIRQGMEQVRDMLAEQRFGDPYDVKFHNT